MMLTLWYFAYMVINTIKTSVTTVLSEPLRVQVMGACFEIFSTWDDEYDKLQGLLRDIVKKKKEDMKLAWKVNPTHKRLQARLDQMRKSVQNLSSLITAVYDIFFINIVFDSFSQTFISATVVVCVTMSLPSRLFLLCCFCSIFMWTG